MTTDEENFQLANANWKRIYILIIYMFNSRKFYIHAHPRAPFLFRVSRDDRTSFATILTYSSRVIHIFLIPHWLRLLLTSLCYGTLPPMLHTHNYCLSTIFARLLPLKQEISGPLPTDPEALDTNKGKKRVEFPKRY